jgi:hypothetical protein
VIPEDIRPYIYIHISSQNPIPRTQVHLGRQRREPADGAVPIQVLAPMRRLDQRGGVVVAALVVALLELGAVPLQLPDGGLPQAVEGAVFVCVFVRR